MFIVYINFVPPKSNLGSATTLRCMQFLYLTHTMLLQDESLRGGLKMQARGFEPRVSNQVLVDIMMV